MIPEAHYRHRKAAFRLIVAGRDISDTVRPRLISLRLTEKRGKDADELEIVLNDADGKMAIPSAGAEIALELGWVNLGDAQTPALTDKGRFKVQKRRHGGTPDRITLTARSADLTRAFRARRTQTWRDTTLGAVLTEIAGRNGLQPVVASALASIEIPHLDQARESDSALLDRLGRVHDAVATVKAGRLLFAPVGAGQTAGGSAIPPATLTRRSGDRHAWESEERGAYTGVIAEWHDRAGAARREVVVGSDENAKRLGRTYASEAAARRAADREFARMERGKGAFSLDLAEGRPDLYPERTLKVSGFKAEIDAAYWLITETSHTLDAGGGLKTALQMELGAAPARAS